MSTKWKTRQPQIQQNTREIYFWGSAKKQPIISCHFKFKAKIWDTTVRKENARPNVQCWVQLSLKPISLSIRLTNIYEHLSTSPSTYLSIYGSIYSIYPSIRIHPGFKNIAELVVFLLPTPQKTIQHAFVTKVPFPLSSDQSKLRLKIDQYKLRYII